MNENKKEQHKKIAEELFFLILWQGFLRENPIKSLDIKESLHQFEKFEELEKDFKEGPKYTIHKQIKKDGVSYRTICAPSENLKTLQKIFLHEFLYPKVCNRYQSITHQKRNKSDFFDGIHGFLKKRSIVTNAQHHQQQPGKERAKYWVRIDFKDAFGSVKKQDIRNLFMDLFLDEIQRYRETPSKIDPIKKEWIKNNPAKEFFWYNVLRTFYSNVLFPVKNFSRFREGLKTWNDQEILEIIQYFTKNIVKLVTYKGSIPQGAPTSPILLNLIVAKSEILEKIQNLLFLEGYQGYEATISIYADDITISTPRRIPDEVLQKIYAVIHQETPFTVHPDKTLFFNRRSIDPLITGVRLRKDDQLTLPKKTQRKIRGLIHYALVNDVDKKTHNRIRGYILWANNIYGKENLPKQIQIPYKEYCKKYM